MTVPPRTCDELHAVPALATLPALSACIEAFLTAINLAHPHLLRGPNPSTERETAAFLLHMHLDTCQHLLRAYDQLTFDVTCWCSSEPDEEGADDPDEEDIPF